ncbi:MAG TPA: alpha/beta hydrolase [Myxococcales bacterium]|nr:alpha/beta hydrolase [Myxococcales bacterium]
MSPAPGPRFLQANGLRFACLEWGRGPLVLALHGFPDTAESWDPLGPKLAAAGFHVVAPYLRGYAPTEPPPRDADSRTLGEDVLGLLDALGEPRAFVVGHDWGAEAAYAAVALAPERVARLVAIGIPHRAALTPTPRLAWALRHFVTLTLPGAEARFARRDLAGIARLWHRWSPTWSFTEGDLAPVKRCLAAPGSLHAALGYYRAASVRTPAFLRRPVEVPTLNVAGADDPSVPPATFEATRAHFRAAFQVAAIPGGHFCHRESPDPFLAAVLPFLTARPPSAREPG